MNGNELKRNQMHISSLNSSEVHHCTEIDANWKITSNHSYNCKTPFCEATKWKMKEKKSVNSISTH